MEVDASRSDDGPVSRSVRGSRGARNLVVLALVIALPLVLAGGLWLWQARALDRAQDAEHEDRAALDAATALTLAWASVDHRKVDEYVDTVRSGATGAFRAQFEKAEPFLRQTLADNKSVQVPTIPKEGAALLERRDDEARVIVAMDAAVSNKSTRRPQPRQYRLQVTLRKEGDQWLVSGLEFIDEAD